MAGKYVGIAFNDSNVARDGSDMGAQVKFGLTHPADRLYRAYSEGRQTVAEGGDATVDNPYNSSVQFFQYRAWRDGALDAPKIDQQYETAVPGTV